MGAALAVETWDLTKTFRGRWPDDNLTWADAIVHGVKCLLRPPDVRTVVDRISLAVKAGEFFGIIGANGAGKTTLLKLLACLVYPDAGGGRVNGHDLRRERTAVRRSVGVAPAASYMGMLWQLTARENLLFRARMGGLAAAEAARRAAEVLERLEIAHKADEYSWNWSAGERQKFGLAMTFITRTPLVLLDEPTSHLDPRTARLIREFVKEDLNRRNGQTVLMSTHYLEEADQMCDRVAILRAGRLLACDNPAALKRAHVPDSILELRVAGYAPEVGQDLKARCVLAELLEHFEDVATGHAQLRPKWPDGAPPDPDALGRALEARGVAVLATERAAPTLDDVYFHLAREQVK